VSGTLRWGPFLPVELAEDSLLTLLLLTSAYRLKVVPVVEAGHGQLRAAQPHHPVRHRALPGRQQGGRLVRHGGQQEPLAGGVGNADEAGDYRDGPVETTGWGGEQDVMDIRPLNALVDKRILLCRLRRNDGERIRSNE
jgi:hypothetical protein